MQDLIGAMSDAVRERASVCLTLAGCNDGAGPGFDHLPGIVSLHAEMLRLRSMGACRPGSEAHGARSMKDDQTIMIARTGLR